MIGKLRSMHLAIPGAMGYFYHLQMALTASNHASRSTAYPFKDLHRDVQFWRYLFVDMVSQPTFFAAIVQCLVTDIGYTKRLRSRVWRGLDQPKTRTGTTKFGACLGRRISWWTLSVPRIPMGALPIQILSWRSWCFKRRGFLSSVPTWRVGLHSPEATIHLLSLGNSGIFYCKSGGS